MRVLMIEDEPAQCWLVRDYIRSAAPSWKVEEAETLTTGFDMLDQGGIHVLLLDLGLPDSLGLETFAKVHARFPDLAVVVLTNLEDNEAASQLVQMGAQDCLVKGQIGGPLLIRALRHALERKQAQLEREELIARLKQALAEVRKLSGLLPICSHCKKIRDDQGYWHQVESYVSANSEAQFSHGLCEDCGHRFYPDVFPEDPAPETLVPG